MTCDSARDALLEADLPIVDDNTSELAAHVHNCAECARLAVALHRSTSALVDVVRRRARKRRRIAILAATSTLAAAAIILAVARLDRVAPRAAVNVERRGIVSVDVPRGKAAMVLQTKDPNVTIVWLTDAPRSGS